MELIEPWKYGPLELMKHAEEHQQANGEFDRHIALIGYDNAIEVSIGTYLHLHPTQRGKVSYSKEQVANWLMNYHTKLNFFFDEFVGTSDITKQTVINYHNLRNDLYHEGKTLVPTERDIQGAREVAIYIFSTLFNTNAEELLKRLPPLHTSTTKNFYFKGKGNGLHKMPLKVGTTIFRFKYDGSGHFIIDLCDENGRRFAQTEKMVECYVDGENITEYTYHYQDSNSVNIKEVGVYLLKIKAHDNWEIEVKQ